MKNLAELLKYTLFISSNDLKEWLKDNNISDIGILQKVKFEKLEKLNLYDNSIDKNKFSSSVIQNLKFKIII